ncbi:hypothetical protein [Carnobacterium gallinarum]|nr:hypothetical protein [Carnobacterium gallinarum]
MNQSSKSCKQKDTFFLKEHELIKENKRLKKEIESLKRVAVLLAKN